MKIDKYKDVYSKLDTDDSMDKRIKDKLVYYDSVLESAEHKIKNTNRKTDIRSFFKPMKRLSFLRVSLPSLTFLLFMVIIIFSVKARMSSDTSSQGTTNNLPSAYNNDGGNSPTDIISQLTATPSPELTAAPTQAPTITPPVVTEELPDITEAPSNNDNVVGTDNSEVTSNNATSGNTEVTPGSTATDDGTTAKTGDFYFATFDSMSAYGIVNSISGLALRFHGTVNKINPDDVTDIILTRDGNQVDNTLSITDRIVQRAWGNEDITDFFFEFNKIISEPGLYGLTGKYKGVKFTASYVIIDGPLTDEPANPDDLVYVGYVYKTDPQEQPISISEVSFQFIGKQNAFNQSDLSDLKMTIDDTEVPFTFTYDVFRYRDYNEYDGRTYTSFNLLLTKECTKPGKYVLTGKYQGKSFTSMEMTIP